MTYTSRILRGWQLHRGAVQSFHVVAARSREICMKVHVYTEMAVCVCMLQPNSMYLLLHFNKSLGLFLLLCLPVLCVSVCFSTLFPVLSVFLSPSVLFPILSCASVQCFLHCSFYCSLPCSDLACKVPLCFITHTA